MASPYHGHGHRQIISTWHSHGCDSIGEQQSIGYARKLAAQIPPGIGSAPSPPASSRRPRAETRGTSSTAQMMSTDKAIAGHVTRPQTFGMMVMPHSPFAAPARPCAPSDVDLVPHGRQPGHFRQVAAIEFVVAHILGQEIHRALTLHAPHGPLNRIKRPVSAWLQLRQGSLNGQRTVSANQAWRRKPRRTREDPAIVVRLAVQSGFPVRTGRDQVEHNERLMRQAVSCAVGLQHPFTDHAPAVRQRRKLVNVAAYPVSEPLMLLVWRGLREVAGTLTSL